MTRRIQAPGLSVLLAAIAGSALTALVIVVAPGSVFLLGLGFLFVAVALVPARSRTSGVLWWMHPGWAFVIGVLPGVVLAGLIPSTYFVREWDTPKFMSSSDFVLVIALTASFVVGTTIGTRLSRGAVGQVQSWPPEVRERLARITKVLLWITLTAYAVWAIIAVARGLRPAGVVANLSGGGIGTTKSYLTPIGGVTTWVGLAPLTVVCLVVLRWLGTDRPTTRYIVLLFAIAVFRALINAERLAILEVAVPGIIAYLSLPRGHPRGRTFVRLLPLWAPVVLLIFFGTFEYFRSWTSDYYREKNAGRTYTEYTMNRLAGYYATAINNGVLQLETDKRVHQVPYFTLRWGWTFPGVGSLLTYDEVSGTLPNTDYRKALLAKGNLALNNKTGVYLPVFDYGPIGGSAFWLLLGTGVGVVFVWFRRQRPMGLLLYPVLFLGMIEAGRVLYWADGRALPAIVGAVIVGHMLNETYAATQRTQSVSLPPAHVPQAHVPAVS